MKLRNSDQVRFDQKLSSVDALFEELERWKDSPALCAAFEPEGLHLVIMTRAHYFSCCTRAERRALEQVRGFALVLIAGPTARAVSLDEFKRAVQQEAEELERGG